MVENVMDRIKLYYKTDDSNKIELPFRILVLGDFTLNDPGIIQHNRESLQVDLKNFNSVLKKCHIRINLNVSNCLYDNDEPLKVNIPIKSMQDFKPDALVSVIPEMKQLVELKHRISTFKKSKTGNEEFQISTLEHGQKFFFKSIGFKGNHFNIDMLNIVNAYIDKRLCQQLDEILHHKKFKHLESIWHSLYFLVDKLEPGENCSIDILSISKKQLQDDFEYWKDIFNSFLYKKIYAEAFGHFGGNPYGVVIANYLFDYSVEDINLLKDIGMVSRASHAPFIGGVDPTFFGEKNFSNISNIRNFKEFFEGPRYKKWLQLRSAENAGYVALIMPRFLLRSRYSDIINNSKNFSYNESPCYLWGNSSFAFGACLLESFKKYRWCHNSTGIEDGQIREIKGIKLMPSVSDQKIMPIEIFIPENMEASLSEAGFIPISIQQGEDCTFFNFANSIKSPIISSKSKQKIVDARLSVQLPYTFIVCRLVHYIKIIQRDNIGSIKDRLELEKELNRWMIQYVSDMENPAQAVKARRPLRKAYIRVEENKKTNNGNVSYMMQLSVTPHFKYMGASFSLSLKTEI